MKRDACVIACVGLLAALAGCKIGNTAGTCQSGETCTCDQIGNCTYDCPGGDCDFVCKGTGNCIFTCEGGGCDLTCDNTGNCIMDCPDNSCSITCKGTGTCILNACAGCEPDGGLAPDSYVSPDSYRPPDAQLADAPLQDLMLPDAGLDDAAVTDMALSDAPVTDTALVDTVAPDTVSPDTFVPDSCIPLTCAPRNCGFVDNGCGGTLDCGTCSVGTCGGGGTPGICGCTATDSAGPQSPTAGTVDTSVGKGGWYTPTAIFTENSGSGSVPSGSAWVRLSSFTDYSHYLVASGFQFNIPTNAIVTGIVVEIRRRARDGYQQLKDYEVKLTDGNTIFKTNLAKSPAWLYTWESASYGGPEELWGHPWTGLEINNPGFGVVLATMWTGTAGNDDCYVDHVTVTVHYATSCP